MSATSRNSGPSESSVHKPVLLREVIRFLDLQPGLTVVDGTVGAGGHSREILKTIGPEGILIGLDRDPMMLKFASQTLTASNCHLRQSSYAELPEILRELGLEHADRVLLDLGLSSDQLADDQRGFGFESQGPLDLRFDPTSGEPAWQLIERVREAELAEIFKKYGEERFSERIARQIVERRKTSPVRTAADLIEAVREAIPRKYQKRAKKHPATRIFQALRIAVNDELSHLENALNDSISRSLVSGGCAVVISFHSLE
ncbi:MAG: 16S rRNA (cytosine(1402)-N(4))-methyltransferase RsmH, partial [Planctomycetes bacterium]|nr:16S rRNA (cytosine(1402)-N(4))-methyltransferase RsmH [Planctomycetota bacterium]